MGRRISAPLAGALLSFLSLAAISAQVCDPDCLNGGECTSNDDGTAVCKCPEPTPLEPSYFRGPQCATPAELCADTATFYCANGATCREIVQGEVYECANCQAPWGGEHCDDQGEPCGSGVCYNGGTCRYAGGCSCPPAWQGSADCNVRTPAGTTNSATSQGAGSSLDPMLLYYILGGLGALLVVAALGAGVYRLVTRRKPKRFLDDPEQDDVIFLQSDAADQRLELELPTTRDGASAADQEHDGGGEDGDESEQAILRAPSRQRSDEP